VLSVVGKSAVYIKYSERPNIQKTV
jgi:hypothetical protein